MDNFVVTFARGFGTGGKAIASQLAKELGIHCYENRILTLASQDIYQEMRSSNQMTGFLSIRARLSTSLRTRNPAS